MSTQGSADRACEPDVGAERFIDLPAVQAVTPARMRAVIENEVSVADEPLLRAVEPKEDVR